MTKRKNNEPESVAISQSPSAAFTVSGKVVGVGEDEKNGIKGVEVTASDKNGIHAKATTETNGAYTIVLPDGGCGTLSYALASYVTKTLRIGGQPVVNVTLLQDTPENASTIITEKINSAYEEISLLVSGNSGNDVSIDLCCTIPLPLVNKKIAQRLSINKPVNS